MLLPLREWNTSRNDMLKGEDGALEVAENILIDANGVAIPADGYDIPTGLAGTFGIGGSRGNRVTHYKSGVLVHYDNATVALLGTGDYSGTFAFPDSTTAPRFVEIASILYLTTSTGLRRLDGTSGTWVSAGIPPAIHFTTGTTAGTVLANTEKKAYRTVWGQKLSTGQILLGRPSQRMVVTATGNQDPTLVVYVPTGITTSHFLQVYATAKSTGGADPGDEMHLVHEEVYVSGSSISVTDSTPDAVMQYAAPLYTNESQEGPLGANDRPPLAKDVVHFNGATFYSDVTFPHRLTLRLLAVGSPAFLVDDTITIAGTTYTAKAAENIASNQFLLTTAGSAAANIEATAQSLINVINRSASNTTVYAHYLSGQFDPPGIILVEARTLGAAAFTATVSARGSSWNPPLPTSGSTVISLNGNQSGAVAVSKFGEQEAVPLTNLLFPGRTDKKVRRMVRVRDHLFVLKEDGIFTITGSDGDWRWDEFDPSQECIAPESVAVLNNEIYFKSREGVVAAGPGGVRNVSTGKLDEEMKLRPLGRDAILQYVHGVSFERENLYILFAEGSAIANAYVYSADTGTWLGKLAWPFLCSTYAGYSAEPLPRVWGALATSNAVVRNNEYTLYPRLARYVRSLSVTASTVTGTTVVLSAAPSGVAAGDIYKSFDGLHSTITAISSATLTLDQSAGTSTGSATIYKAMTSTIQWAPQSAGKPGVIATELVLHVSQAAFLSGTAYFATDYDQTFQSVTFSGTQTVPQSSVSAESTSDLRIRIPIPYTLQSAEKFIIKLVIRQAMGMFRLQAAELVTVKET